MSPKPLVPVSSILLVLLFSGFLITGDVHLRSSDLRIADGSVVTVDGKPVGTAPCEFAVSTGQRYKIEAKEAGGEVRTIFFLANSTAKSNQVKDIPAWFLNPDLLRSQYPGYEALTAATATSRTIEIALSKADLDATSRLIPATTNLYPGNPSNREKRMLDSTRSKSYPRLTRGQMDSLAITNGGRMIVTTSSSTVSRTVLLVEVQKVGSTYRVYVAVGLRK